MEHSHIKAKKSLGQNFLIDHEALSDISTSLEISGKHIIEVGPGYGALTDYILESNPLSLDLVELDKDMVKILRSKFDINGVLGIDDNQLGVVWGEKLSETDDNVVQGIAKRAYPKGISNATLSQRGSSFLPNSFGTFSIKSTEGITGEKIEIQLSPRSRDKPGMTETPITLHHQDVLTYSPSYERYSVVANIPYYITSPILFYFLYNLPHAPEEMVIMMQKEVGEKILEGRAKKQHHSFLSLSMEQACDDIEMIRLVGRASFNPPPKVDSIVLKFSGKKDRDTKLEKQLLSLWKVAFAHPRKTLLSNMKGSNYDLEGIRAKIIKLGYDERVRAEAVRREDWVKFL